MKIVMILLGVLMMLTGLLWVGQGLGFVHWPASSFMIDERPWAWRGAVLAVVGVVVLWFGARR